MSDAPEPAHAWRRDPVLSGAFGLITFFATYFGIKSDPSVDPTMKILPVTTASFFASAAVFAMNWVVPALRLKAAQSRSVVAARGGSLPFVEWYRSLFGQTSTPVQIVMWFVYGFVWIPVLFAAHVTSWGTWYRARLGKWPLSLQVLVWWLYGFLWIPIWYAVTRPKRARS